MQDWASGGVPFSEIDQACAASEDAFGPFNGELAIETRTHFDLERLRAAVARAMRRHFVCGARRRRVSALHARDLWVPAEDRVEDAVLVRQGYAVEEEGVAAERDAFLEEFLPTTRVAPFRLLLSRRADGDLLTISASHVATDGLGSFHLLRTIAAEYAGRRGGVGGVGYLEARRFLARLAPDTPEARARRWRAVGEIAREVWPTPTSHVAPSPGREACQATGGTWSGVHHHRIPWASVRRRAEGPTVNDVLSVAVLLAVEEHNARLGVRCRRMSLLVPLNLRPAHWLGPIGNFSIVGLVVSHARDRVDPGTFLTAIARQGRRLRADRATAGMLSLMRTSASLPLWAQDPVTRLAYACEGLIPTAILSNLGRVEHPPDFGAQVEVRGLWASPPCRSPCALGVGAVFHDGAIHLSIRYRRDVLAPADVNAIARRIGVEATELARFR